MAKRRANGEGNIRKRKDGRWEGRYTAGRDPDTGKPIYKNVLGKTQAETKEKLKQAIEENKGLDVVKAGRYTVGQWMDVWFENYAKIKVRPSSHQIVHLEHTAVPGFPEKCCKLFRCKCFHFSMLHLGQGAGISWIG